MRIVKTLLPQCSIYLMSDNLKRCQIESAYWQVEGCHFMPNVFRRKSTLGTELTPSGAEQRVGQVTVQLERPCTKRVEHFVLTIEAHDRMNMPKTWRCVKHRPRIFTCFSKPRQTNTNAKKSFMGGSGFWRKFRNPLAPLRLEDAVSFSVLITTGTWG